MRLKSLQASELAIPFKGSFKHASADRQAMQSLWIQAESEEGHVGFGEGCPREYVTAESLGSAMAFFHAHCAEWMSIDWDIHRLRRWVSSQREEIDANPAAWTAVEVALLDLLGKSNKSSLERLLELADLSGSYWYTAIIGDGPPEQFAVQLHRFLEAGFRTFKIKLSRDLGANEVKVRLLADAGISGAAVRADANNLWPDAAACVRELKSLPYRFAALEEPLQPGDLVGLEAVAQSLDTRIILDESVSRIEHLNRVPASPDVWIVNCRVSKMGGLFRSLDLLRSATSRDLGIVIGAHVGETSVLTRAALSLVSPAGGRLRAQEGAFGTHLLSHDVANPPWTFGAGGALHVTEVGLASRPGLGLNVSLSGV